MKIKLAYGRHGLTVDLPEERTTFIEPSHSPGLPEERKAVRDALAHPLGARPFREWITARDRVCIAFTDITRATPNHRIIPWLLNELHDLPRDQITLLNQNGTHRPNTRAELEEMLTPEVVADYRVVNHESGDAAAMVQVGTMGDGSPALLNRLLVEADVRIITGFIEPHFFAGFSGGVKGIIPGCASLETVMANHRPGNIGHPNATYGITEGNPLWEELRDVALRVGPSFVLNVALNARREITGVFAGDLIEAHRKGCEFVRASAMQRVPAAFDIVVTTNSGYPLDLNLYQGVKGMTAGARVVKPGGTIILASECCEGVPDGSPCDRLLRSVRSPEKILELIARPGFRMAEQWQAQIQALVQRKANVLLFSSLPDDVVKACHLKPCHDIGAEVARLLADLGPNARVAVLPQGPLTIPYLG
jgi:nickel-dependent lactate racemase